MMHHIQFVLNGQEVRMADCPVNLTLLEFLRRRGLTGAKEGCAEGDCGACSVLLLEQTPAGQTAYRTVNSCLTPLCLLAGHEIVTVEGIARPDALHPVQRALVERHGSQCGYCTPGLVASLLEAYHRRDLKTSVDLDHQLCGNLCRCTGYRPIRDAAVAALAGRETPDAFPARRPPAHRILCEVRFESGDQKFFRPTTLAELFRQIESHPDARLVAGATEIGVEITRRQARFCTLISLEAIPELKEIRREDSAWQIGATATLTAVEETAASDLPVLRDMLELFGSRQIRNRATLGGNLVTASPIGDAAPVLLALDARLVLASAQGERTLPIEEFCVAYRQTALRRGEILKAIIIPSRSSVAGLNCREAWFKVTKRRETDISTVAACFSVDLDDRGTVRRARLAYGGVAPTPARAFKTEAALLGRPWNPLTVQQILPILRTEFSPISDVRGSAEYRRALVTSLLQKFCDSPDGSDDASRATAVELPTTAPAPCECAPHESAHLHVTGEAQYVDDEAMARGCLEVWPVCAPLARARILKRNADAARQMKGVTRVLLAEDIPGPNDVGATVQDEILLADKEVSFHGQLVALVVGESQELCRLAAEQVRVEYEPLRPLLSLREAIEASSFHNAPNWIRRADCEQALQAAPLTLEGELDIAGQEHFYLETQAAWAQREEDGAMTVVSSTQNPSEIQRKVAEMLNLPANRVVVRCPRIGGGFGGKETQAATPATLAALAAYHTGKPVRVRFSRAQDMTLTGHRHPFLARFKVGFDCDGLLKAARIHVWSNGGWATDLSQAITDRALFHLDNGYYIPAVEFRGQVAKTNVASNTAMRGFGGPQGMLVIEDILDRIARRLGLRPEVVRERNLYRGQGETNTTHYGQPIRDNRIQLIWRELQKSADFSRRRENIVAWNEAHRHRKRGLAMTPLKFGISFTFSPLNQAAALVLIYRDGTVQVNHGGTEMGQGLHTNIIAIAARELGLASSQIRVMPTCTDKVPNTSATAASVGTDMNGAAVKNACDILRTRLLQVAVGLWRSRFGHAPEPGDLVFAEGFVSERGRTQCRLPFHDIVQKAYLERISLSATGYYATPGIGWDRETGQGEPFHYFANGAAATEVEVDGFTGQHRVLRVDILQDVGASINEEINRGQIEGGFIQGMGWLTTEELQWDSHGRLLTHSPDTYKIPTVGDIPPVLNVTLLKHADQEDVVFGTKAVGEPPLMLALSVREAIRDAVAAFGPSGHEVPLPTPATCEAIFFAIRAQTGPQPSPRLD